MLIALFTGSKFEDIKPISCHLLVSFPGLSYGISRLTSRKFTKASPRPRAIGETAVIKGVYVYQ